MMSTAVLSINVENAFNENKSIFLDNNKILICFSRKYSFLDPEPVWFKTDTIHLYTENNLTNFYKAMENILFCDADVNHLKKDLSNM